MTTQQPIEIGFPKRLVKQEFLGRGTTEQKMNNVFDFWDTYNKECLQRLKALVLEKEKSGGPIYTDFHIHSDNSSDGKQPLIDILNNTKQKGLDTLFFIM